MSFKVGKFYPSKEIKDLETLLKMTLYESFVDRKKIRIIDLYKKCLTRNKLVKIILNTYIKKQDQFLYATSSYSKITKNWFIDYILFDVEKSLVLIISNIREESNQTNDFVMYYKELNKKEIKEYSSAIKKFHETVKKRFSKDFKIEVA